MKLTVAIITFDERKHYLNKLLAVLQPQLTDEVELLLIYNNEKKTIGEKRNEAVSIAQGEYFFFLDDDDMIAPNFIQKILEGLKTNPDTVTYLMHYYRDGILTGLANIDLKNRAYENVRLPWKNVFPNIKPPLKIMRKAFLYKRIPHHLCPTKLELVKQVPYMPMNTGEDSDYAKRIKPLIKTQYKIEEVMYYYYFRSIKKEKL